MAKFISLPQLENRTLLRQMNRNVAAYNKRNVTPTAMYWTQSEDVNDGLPYHTTEEIDIEMDVESEVSPAPDSPSASSNSSNPKTGDQSGLVLWITIDHPRSHRSAAIHFGMAAQVT